MNDEIIENIKRKLIKSEEKIKRFNTQKLLLFKKLSESNRKSDLKINYGYYAEIEEEISYLNDWIEFYSKWIQRYKIRLEKLEQCINNDKSEIKDIENSFNLIFKDKEKESSIDKFDPVNNGFVKSDCLCAASGLKEMLNENLQTLPEP